MFVISINKYYNSRIGDERITYIIVIRTQIKLIKGKGIKVSDTFEEFRNNNTSVYVFPGCIR